MAPTFSINGDLSGHDLAQQIVEIFENQNLLDKQSTHLATATPTSILDAAPSQVNSTAQNLTASNLTSLNYTSSDITALNSIASNTTSTTNTMLLACGGPGNGTVTTACLRAVKRELDSDLSLLYLMLIIIILLQFISWRPTINVHQR